MAGAGLLWASAGIHLDLYLTGYRTIPTIGWLFVLQVVVGLVLGAAVLVTGSGLAAAAGAVFALATLGGYLLSVQFGMFGFREVRTTAGIVAGIAEVLAFAALAGYALTRRWPRLPAIGRPQAALATAGVSVVAFGLMAGALAGASGATAPPTSHSLSGAQLGTTRIDGVTVLTNAAGRTLYWFAPDTSTKSACYGSCAAYWPPVPGPAKLAPGVPGTLGTITRTGGSLQETYDGHPLYTYIADTAPGQARGNNVNLNGGLWHEVVVGRG